LHVRIQAIIEIDGGFLSPNVDTKIGFSNFLVQTLTAECICMHHVKEVVFCEKVSFHNVPMQWDLANTASKAQHKQILTVTQRERLTQ